MNSLAESCNHTEDSKLEITFVNSDASYYAIMNAISEIGSASEVRYPVNSLYQPFNVVSVSCYKISEHSLIQFKNKIGACAGFVSICDSSMK